MHTEIVSIARHYNEEFAFIRVNIGYINRSYNHDQKLLYKLAETILHSHQCCHVRMVIKPLYLP